jgi:hypothetical protein
LLLFAGACADAPITATSPSPSPAASPTSPASPANTSGETPVEKQVLTPASDAPVADLCTAAIVVSADGNASPVLCASGAVNVQAWRFYSGVSASVLGLGLNPTEGQVESAICDDLAHNHATRSEEANGYRLASTYYGWSFTIDVSKVTCS